MNKFSISLILVAVIAVVLGTAVFVSAQAPTPQPNAPGYGNGRGMRGGGMMAADEMDGPLHDAMMAVFAQKLGVSVADLETRMKNGETMAQIATTKGLTTEQFTALMTDARSQAIDQAVKAGTLTQEQADWMKQRGAGQMGGMMNGQGQGQGRGQMMGGGRGGMRGGAVNGANASCPMFQTNP